MLSASLAVMSALLVATVRYLASVKLVKYGHPPARVPRLKGTQVPLGRGDVFVSEEPGQLIHVAALLHVVDGNMSV